MSDVPGTPSAADDAAALLNAAAQGDEAGARLSRSAIGPFRTFTFALAALIGAYFLALIYPLSDADSVVVWVATGIYLVALAAVVIGFLRARRATAPRSDRAHIIGTAATVALFLLGALLSTIIETRTPFLWIPYAIVMLVPLVLSAFGRASR